MKICLMKRKYNGWRMDLTRMMNGTKITLPTLPRIYRKAKDACVCAEFANKSILPPASVTFPD